MKRWMIEDSTEPSTNRIKFLLDGVEATPSEFAQWIRDLTAEKDNAVLQVGEMRKALEAMKAKLEKSHDGGCILPLRDMVNDALAENGMRRMGFTEKQEGI